MKKNVVILLSGGLGKRFSSSTPKQFYHINDKTILEHTINVFQNNNLIDEILLVSSSEYISKTKEIIKNNFSKVIDVIEGGEERFFSSYNAVIYLESKINDHNFNVIIHDIVRPLISSETISEIIKLLSCYEAVIACTKSKDTIYLLNKKGKIDLIPKREKVLLVQTPQAFNFKLLLEAYKNALGNKDYKYTDDASLVLNFRKYLKYAFVNGTSKNIKITTLEDLDIAKLFIVD